MKFFWTFIWSLLLSSVLSYILTSMGGSSFNLMHTFVLAVILSIAVFSLSGVLNSDTDTQA